MKIRGGEEVQEAKGNGSPWHCPVLAADPLHLEFAFVDNLLQTDIVPMAHLGRRKVKHLKQSHMELSFITV